MNELLFNAFRALGSAPTKQEIQSVAESLRKSGDEEIGPLLDYASRSEAWERALIMAETAEAYGFVALDLATAYHSPGYWAGFINGAEAA
jgi:hypothetical protein